MLLSGVMYCSWILEYYCNLQLNAEHLREMLVHWCRGWKLSRPSLGSCSNPTFILGQPKCFETIPFSSLVHLGERKLGRVQDDLSRPQTHAASLFNASETQTFSLRPEDPDRFSFPGSGAISIAATNWWMVPILWIHVLAIDTVPWRRCRVMKMKRTFDAQLIDLHFLLNHSLAPLGQEDAVPDIETWMRRYASSDGIEDSQ